MPNVLDLAFVGLFALAWPAYGYYVDWPAFQRRLREAPGAARLREYRTTVVWQWLIVAIGVALWLRAGRPWSSLALQVPAGWRLWVPAGALLLLGAGYASQAVKVARHPRARAHLRKVLASLEAILPHTTSEFAWFLLTSVTAGICEELLFRGYFVWTLTPWLGWWGAAALSAPAFGLLHAYQGRKGTIRTAAVGAVMTLVVAGTRSLLPAMALHVLIDIGAGTVAWLGLRESDSASD